MCFSKLLFSSLCGCIKLGLMGALAPLFLYGAPELGQTPPEKTLPNDGQIIKRVEVRADFDSTTHEMKDETLMTFHLLNDGHMKKLNPLRVDSFSVIQNYVGRLDPMHLFFLSTDLDGYQSRYGALFDLHLRQGNLIAAFNIYKDFYERVEKRIDWINKRLTQPFDLDTKDTYVADRSKLEWPRKIEEADSLWENRLKLDLIIELLGDEKQKKGKGKKEKNSPESEKNKKKMDAGNAETTTKTSEETFSKERLSHAIERIRKRYEKIHTYLRVEPHEVQEYFLNAITAQYDPHTTFFSKQSRDDFNVAINNKLIGIGAVLGDEDGYCVVKSIIPGGPVEASKRIRVGDRITAIGQGEKNDLVDIVGLRLSKVVSQLRGKTDTIVRLRIEPASDRADRYTISLTRNEIKLTTKLAQATLYEIPAGNEIVPVGLIDLPAFYGKGEESGPAFSTTENVAELIRKLKGYKIRGLILDFRYNGGGYLNEACNLASLFIPADLPVVQVKDTHSRPNNLNTPANGIFRAQDANVLWNGPLIVLVTKLSASASEIIAGAFKDYKRALIIGDENTHGKGTVQTVFDYERYKAECRSSLKLTVQKWYLPSGKSIQLKGVAADILLPSIYSTLPVAESDLERPLEWDSIASILPADLTKAWSSSMERRTKELKKHTPSQAASSKATDYGPEFVLSPELVSLLRANSVKRQAELPEFQSFNKLLSWRKSREGTRAFPINYEALKAERKNDRAFQDSVKRKLQNLEPLARKKEVIKLDATLEQEKKSAGEGQEKKNKDSKHGSSGHSELDEEEESDEEENEAAKGDSDIQVRESLRIMGDWLSLAQVL
ncbi:MAG: carboxy terminal-processing peptidase [Puniceicoccales bacterium]|nr:carboxy terminal-processing peptidase [Puniceicoccales bacterium]